MARHLGLGAATGALAATLLLVPLALFLRYGPRWSIEAEPRAAVPVSWLLAIAFATTGAGAVAAVVAGAVDRRGAAANQLPQPGDRSSWIVCLPAGLAWSLVASLLSDEANALRGNPGALILGGMALGALGALGIYVPVLTAVQAAPRGWSARVWAAARRVAAFAGGLLGALALAPLTLFGGAALLSVIVRPGFPPNAEPEALRGLLWLLAGWFAAAALTWGGFRLAGVPRRWPTREAACVERSGVT